MPPAERRGRMNAAQRRGLGQALAFDHCPGVIEPLLLLAQMRHRRFGQRVERAPAGLATVPQKSIRTAPADDLATRAMWTPLSRDALHPARAQRVLPTAAPASLLPFRPGFPRNRSRLLKRRHRLRTLTLAHPRNR